MAEVDPARIGRVDETAVNGRDGHEDGASVFLQRAQCHLGVEGGQQEGSGAGMEGAVQGDDQAVDVEDRKHVQEPVVGAPAPRPVEGIEVGGQVAVGKLGALGPAGGAAGVDHEAGGIGVLREGASDRFVIVQPRQKTIGARDQDHFRQVVQLVGQRSHRLGGSSIREKQGDCGIIQEVA